MSKSAKQTLVHWITTSLAEAPYHKLYQLHVACNQFCSTDLIMWSLAILCTLIHPYFFFMGPFVACDAFSDSFCKLASHVCHWDMAMSK